MSPKVLLLLKLGLLLFTLAANLKTNTVASRPKRFVAFRKGSTFFYRLNYKVNVVPYTTIFAHASGFKIGWELPQKQTHPKRKARSTSSSLSLSDIQNGAQFLYESHGFSGQMCLLKSLCQAMDLIQQRDGVLAKVLNLLSGSYEGNGTTTALDPLVCQSYANHCPLHLIGFNGFTEH